MEKREEKKKDCMRVLGGRDGIERKVEKLTFIENLLCASDYEITNCLHFARRLLKH